MAQQVSIYNRDVTPWVQSVLAGLGIDAAIDSGSIGRQCFFRFKGQLYVYSTTNLTLYRVTSPANSGVIAASGIPVVITPAAINSADEFQERLWMGTISAGTVYSWDGQYFGQDVTSLGSGPIIMAAHHETVLAFGTNYCQKRQIDGSWTAVTMPGGLSSFVPRCKAIYLDNLYVGGYDNAGSPYPGKILKYDGTTLTVANSVVTGNTTQSYAGVTALASFNGYLYYGYQKKGTSPACYIGRYDNSTWSDTHASFPALSGSGVAIGALTEYRGNLMAGFDYGSLWQSTGTTTSTYTRVADAVTPGSGGIFDMIPNV